MTWHTETKEKQMNMKRKVGENLKKIKHRIAILSGKGGVGKSTVATNLAVKLSTNGKNTGLLDVDIHGPNIPKMLGIEDVRLSGDRNGILPITTDSGVKVISMAFLLQNRDTPVIWRGPLKMGAIQQFLGEVNWGSLDYLVIDLPPGTGDELLSVAQLIPEGIAVIVTTPQDVALLDSRKAVNFARALNMKVAGIIENMSGLACPYCGKNIDLFKTGGGEKAALDLGVPFLGRIPIDPVIVQTGDAGKPFIIGYSESECSKAFDEVVKNIVNFINSKR